MHGWSMNGVSPAVSGVVLRFAVDGAKPALLNIGQGKVS